MNSGPSLVRRRFGDKDGILSSKGTVWRLWLLDSVSGGKESLASEQERLRDDDHRAPSGVGSEI